MKTLIILVSIILSTQAFADVAPLVCEGQPFEATHVRVFGEDYHHVGSVSHQYSSARIVCPLGAKYRAERGKPFKCAGVWAFDMRRDGNNDEDTVVVVKFEPSQKYGVDFTAQFLTNYAYGRKKMSLDCRFRD